MSAFERALARVFDLEGGVADHPADRGGVTKLGISLRFLRALGPEGGGDLTGDGTIDYEDVLAVDYARGAQLYRRHFWEPSGADQLATLDEALGEKQLQFAVVAGPSRAVQALQRALGDTRAPVGVDGSYGDRTHAAARHVAVSGFAGELLQALRRRQAEHFTLILSRDHLLEAIRRAARDGIIDAREAEEIRQIAEGSQLHFALGWIRRALDLDA